MRLGKKTAVIYTLCAVILFGLGYFTATRISGKPTKEKNSSQQGYPLLAKRLFVDNPSNTRINFSPLRANLNKYFADKKIRGSVYFEYLPTGTSVRVDPDGRFPPVVARR